jgi:hypothetical protein
MPSDTLSLTCVWFPGVEVRDDVLSFYLLAIPLLNEQHTGESLCNKFVKVLDSLCPVWRDKLIGSSTDGAPNMTGCYVGFATLLANDVSSFTESGASLTSLI